MTGFSAHLFLFPVVLCRLRRIELTHAREVNTTALLNLFRGSSTCGLARRTTLLMNWLCCSRRKPEGLTASPVHLHARARMISLAPAFLFTPTLSTTPLGPTFQIPLVETLHPLNFRSFALSHTLSRFWYSRCLQRSVDLMNCAQHH
jgi:hypothetical protein